MFYVVMNHDMYLHRNEEQFTVMYDDAARFNTAADAECSKGQGCRVVGPCKEGEEP